MKKILFAIVILLIGSSLTFAAPIDLRTGWSRQGNFAVWNVSSDGTSVLQTLNSNPTYFVSDADYINTTFNGSFGVETGTDDDFIGFVFGFTSLTDFYLFDWKQIDQHTIDGWAYEGFTLSHITGNDVNLWDHSGTDIDVLATNYGSDKGWVNYTSYSFSLDYSVNKITIAIDSTDIFDVNGTYATGRFGFYDYSQPDVQYHDFEENQHGNPVPIPGAIWLLGSGLFGLVAIRRKRV
jgi:hypothetical protein